MIRTCISLWIADQTKTFKILNHIYYCFSRDHWSYFFPDDTEHVLLLFLRLQLIYWIRNRRLVHDGEVIVSTKRTNFSLKFQNCNRIVTEAWNFFWCLCFEFEIYRLSEAAWLLSWSKATCVNCASITRAAVSLETSK